ncbi:hypothetical protein EMMF5_003386 [Cystobasidiomycetes sp. EMM_F5]
MSAKLPAQDAPTASTSSSDAANGQVAVNPRGIPKAVFIEDLEAFLGGPDVEAEPELAKLNEVLACVEFIPCVNMSIYLTFMEKTFASKKASLEDKIPELKNTLGDEEEALTTHFELTDTLFAKATIEPVEEVYLWLGANTMLAYPPAEAAKLLQEKLDSAETTVANTKSDLLFLREQITTAEVNVARLYNHDVKLRRDRRLKAEAEDAGKA